MRILIVEDEAEKYRRLSTFLLEHVRASECIQAASLNSGLRMLESSDMFDLLLLDMSLPSFDVGLGQSGGGDPQTFGGEEVMDILDAERVSIPTILFTGFDKFFEGTRTIKLTAIDESFKKKYDWYKGFVRYRHTNEAWRTDLLKLLKQVLASGDVV